MCVFADCPALPGVRLWHPALRTAVPIRECLPHGLVISVPFVAKVAVYVLTAFMNPSLVHALHVSWFKPCAAQRARKCPVFRRSMSRFGCKRSPPRLARPVAVAKLAAACSRRIGCQRLQLETCICSGEYASHTWHNLKGAIQALVNLRGDDFHPRELVADSVDALRRGNEGKEHDAGLQDTLVQQHLLVNIKPQLKRAPITCQSCA